MVFICRAAMSAAFLLLAPGLFCFPSSIEVRLIPSQVRPPCKVEKGFVDVLNYKCEQAKIRIAVDVHKNEIRILPEDKNIPTSAWHFDFDGEDTILSGESAQIDLNQDGIQDAIVEFSQFSSGLAAEFSIKLVALSTKEGFELIEIGDASSLKNGLLRVKDSKIPAYIHTNYAVADHAFWMSQLLVFAPSVTIDNALHPDFPLWMPFMHRDGLHARKMPSPEMKRKELVAAGKEDTYYFVRKGKKN